MLGGGACGYVSVVLIPSVEIAINRCGPVGVIAVGAHLSPLLFREYSRLAIERIGAAMNDIMRFFKMLKDVVFRAIRNHAIAEFVVGGDFAGCCGGVTHDFYLMLLVAVGCGVALHTVNICM